MDLTTPKRILIMGSAISLGLGVGAGLIAGHFGVPFYFSFFFAFTLSGLVTMFVLAAKLTPP